MNQDPTPAWLVSPLSWLWAAFVALAGLLSYFGRREMKRIDTALQDHSREIQRLQEGRVTREDLDELRESLTATVNNGYDRLNRDVERRHQENREERREMRSTLDSISERIDRIKDT